EDLAVGVRVHGTSVPPPQPSKNAASPRLGVRFSASPTAVLRGWLARRALAALRVQDLLAAVHVAAGLLPVALLVLRGEVLPVLPGHQHVGPEAAGAADGAARAAQARAAAAGAYGSLRSSHSRYSSIR